MAEKKNYFGLQFFLHDNEWEYVFEKKKIKKCDGCSSVRY